jgi:hypothetical protein
LLMLLPSWIWPAQPPSANSGRAAVGISMVEATWTRGHVKAVAIADGAYFVDHGIQQGITTAAYNVYEYALSFLSQRRARHGAWGGGVHSPCVCVN